MLIRIVVTVLAILLLSIAMVAAQDMPCAERERVIPILRQMGERQVGIMTLENGVALYLWVNPKSGTWTVLSGVPGHDVICLSGAGEAVTPAALFKLPEEPPT